MTTALQSVRQFAIACLAVSLWVNASEIFRYFVIVMPDLRQNLSMVPGVAPMNLGVFTIWGFWDTLLVVLVVFAYWLCAARFGPTRGAAVIAGTFSWLLLFVLFWIAMVNMALARPALLLRALPLSWIELVVSALIARSTLPRREAAHDSVPAWAG